MEIAQYPVLPIRECIRRGWETFKKQPLLFAVAVRQEPRPAAARLRATSCSTGTLSLKIITSSPRRSAFRASATANSTSAGILSPAERRTTSPRTSRDASTLTADDGDRPMAGLGLQPQEGGQAQAVGQVQIVRSLDDRFGLDEKAIEAVKRWRFRPGTRQGKPVAVLVNIELTFTLR